MLFVLLCLSVVLVRLSVPVHVIDWKRLISEMTYNVLMGTLSLLSFSHLGHIITSSLSDKEDVRSRRNCFIGQVNNMICFFSKLSCSTRTKLFQAYCTVTADMDVNYGHYMTTLLTTLMLHGERQ